MSDNQTNKLNEGVEEADEAIEAADVDDIVEGHISARSADAEKKAAARMSRYSSPLGAYGAIAATTDRTSHGAMWSVVAVDDSRHAPRDHAARVPLGGGGHIASTAQSTPGLAAKQPRIRERRLDHHGAITRADVHGAMSDMAARFPWS